MSRYPATTPLILILLLSVLPSPAQEKSRKVTQLWAPFAHGQRHPVWQGAGVGIHSDIYNRNAIDFSPLAVGTPIHTACTGVVIYVKEDTAGPTGNSHDNNEIAIRRQDGNVVVYLHLRQNGSAVEVGDKVLAGDRIGWSGNTGNSKSPHLHIDVREGRRLGPSIPWRFREWKGKKPPRRGDLIRSGNYPVRPTLARLLHLEELYELCAALDVREALAREMQRLPSTKMGMHPPKDRPDLLEQWQEKRRKLLARHAQDGADALQSLRRQLAKGDLAAAVGGALLGGRDYAGLPEQREFQRALHRLEKDPDFGQARKALGSVLARRRQFVRAVKAELTARTTSSKNAPIAWSKARAAWEKAKEGLLGGSPDPAAEKLGRRIETHLRSVGRRFHLPSDSKKD